MFIIGHHRGDSVKSINLKFWKVKWLDHDR
jgi:hypothetical protein